jgi:hypothetical protein
MHKVLSLKQCWVGTMMEPWYKTNIGLAIEKSTILTHIKNLDN